MNTQRFIDLPIGTPFEFQGECYIKNGPLTASHAVTEAQRLIPRSALVDLAVSSTPHESAASPPPLIEEQTVMAAFEAFYAGCVDCLKGLETRLDLETRQTITAELERAKNRFLQRLSQARRQNPA